MKESDDLLGANCLRRRKKQNKKKRKDDRRKIEEMREYKSGSALVKSVTVDYNHADSANPSELLFLLLF